MKIIKYFITPLIKLRLFLRADDPQARENDHRVKHQKQKTPKASVTKGPDNGTTDKPVKTGAFAGLFAFLLLAASPAKASISSILNSLVSKFADMFKPLIEGVMSVYSSILNAFTDLTTGGLTAAFVKGFDAKMGLDSEMFENSLSAATEPPPQMYESDFNAKGIVKTEEISRELASNLTTSASSTYDAIRQYNVQGDFEVNGVNLVNKYGNQSDYKKIFDTPLVSGANISSAEQRVLAVDKVNMATYSAIDNMKIPVNISTPSAKKQYLEAVSRVGKVETARHVLLSNLSERVVTPGASESELSLLEAEVNRPLGSDSYRGDLSSYADSTPLVAELNKQLALNNKISLKLLNKTDQQVQLAALSLIDQVGRD